MPSKLLQGALPKFAMVLFYLDVLTCVVLIVCKMIVVYYNLNIENVACV